MSTGVTFRPIQAGDKECSICKDIDADSRMIAHERSGSLHPAHLNCLNTWIKQRLSQGLSPDCPDCREVCATPLRVESYTRTFFKNGALAILALSLPVAGFLLGGETGALLIRTLEKDKPAWLINDRSGEIHNLSLLTGLGLGFLLYCHIVEKTNSSYRANLIGVMSGIMLGCYLGNLGKNKDHATNGIMLIAMIFTAAISGSIAVYQRLNK